jgi:hypothetical protein
VILRYFIFDYYILSCHVLLQKQSGRLDAVVRAYRKRVYTSFQTQFELSIECYVRWQVSASECWHLHRSLRRGLSGLVSWRQSTGKSFRKFSADTRKSDEIYARICLHQNAVLAAVTGILEPYKFPKWTLCVCARVRAVHFTTVF